MFLLPLQEIESTQEPLVGGKAIALAQLLRLNVNVPDGMVVTTDAYQCFVDASGLKNEIRRELSWRPAEEMRWEEMWDASLRIRNAFLKAPLPSRLRKKLYKSIWERFGESPVAVRSSAPGEDSASQSFAGLHDSYLNLRGPDEILKHVQMVWASLWSDGAILYRKDLGLDIEKSSMAVVIQELIPGTRSGVVFSQHPTKSHCAAIESVYGLNQGLVDGTIEPDRWTLDRKTGKTIEFDGSRRENNMILNSTGVVIRKLPSSKSQKPPLSDKDVSLVYKKARELEDVFSSAQDVEWTFKGTELFILQSRAITTYTTQKTDNRAWYLSLKRSLANLEQLRHRIEKEMLPAMDEEARAWETVDIHALSNDDLEAELKRRFERYEMWFKRYWDDCIPFAHGVRLFGQSYNDSMQPTDPYEFVELLSGSGLLSIKRNNTLQELGHEVNADGSLYAAIEEGDVDGLPSRILEKINYLTDGLANRSMVTNHERNEWRDISVLILRIAQDPGKVPQPRSRERKELQKAYLSKFSGKKRREARDLLDLGRASFRLRDDDNIYLGRIARNVTRVEQVAEARGLSVPKKIRDARGLRPTGGRRHSVKPPPQTEAGFTIKARQISGQPAGPGFAMGEARIVETREQLYSLKAGEVLVCDSVDPNMTFVLPMVSAIVECRGGMLIHGAIIAREYGIPCVTGVTQALSALKTGDKLQVDGFLGLVTVG